MLALVAVDAFRQSEIRYRRLFEAAHDGVLILDSVSRKITDANPFMDQLLGYPHEELLGIATPKRFSTLHCAHSKVRRSKPGSPGSIRDNLIGLLQVGQGKMPISASENGIFGLSDGMMLTCDKAGAQHSQSPGTA